MDIRPFTRSQAEELAYKFRGTVSIKFREAGLVYETRYIAIVPYAEAHKLKIAALYLNFFKNIMGFSIENIEDYVGQYQGVRFDVMLIAAAHTDDGINLAAYPLSLVSKDNELEYDFVLP